MGIEDELKGVVRIFIPWEKQQKKQLAGTICCCTESYNKNTGFPHINVHLGTCKVLGSQTVNVVDYVLTKKGIPHQ